VGCDGIHREDTAGGVPYRDGLGRERLDGSDEETARLVDRDARVREVGG
jgi:hypothetical protein